MGRVAGALPGGPGGWRGGGGIGTGPFGGLCTLNVTPWPRSRLPAYQESRFPPRSTRPSERADPLRKRYAFAPIANPERGLVIVTTGPEPWATKTPEVALPSFQPSLTVIRRRAR